MKNPRSREAARYLLKRMEKDHLVKHQKTKYAEVDNLWMVPGTRSIELGKFEHDIATGAWLYVRLLERLEYWAVERPIGHGLVCDRFMRLRGSEGSFALEVDMGNMKRERIEEKLAGYIRYLGRDERAVFILKDGEATAKKVGTWILTYCWERKRKYQIGVVRFDTLISDPWSSCIRVASGDLVSFEQMATEGTEKKTTVL